MTVTVRLFASYAEKLGHSQMDFDFPQGSTVADVVSRVALLPGGAHLPAAPLVSVNYKYATSASVLAEGDEVALIPPVAGG